MYISQAEEDDFYESLRRNGFDEKDFLLKDKDVSKVEPGKIYPIHLEITVNRVSNKKQKCYQGGHGTQWNSEFENDLISGFFD